VVIGILLTAACTAGNGGRSPSVTASVPSPASTSPLTGLRRPLRLPQSPAATCLV